MSAPCKHAKIVVYRDENVDRIRTMDVCKTCGRSWYGCCAKQLDEEGRPAWGTPNEWRFEEGPRPIGFTAGGEPVFGGG